MIPGALERRLLFVTGKGGVGRTTIAAALALLASRRDRRTLVCELAPGGGLAAAYETAPLGFAEREVEPGLWAMSMDTEASLREYLRVYLHVPLVTRLGPMAHAFDFVAQAAPGVREILTIGKLCHEVRTGRWDLIVVDASPSGHVIGQLDAPAAINDLVKVGPVREQTGWMRELLADPVTTGALIVVTPEEMPVNETVELAGRLRDETQVNLAAVVVNRVLPELFGRGEERVFERLRDEGSRAELARAVGGDPAPVLAAADLAVTMRRTRAEHLSRLRAGLGGAASLWYVPYLFSRSHGLRATSQVATALSAEIGF